MNPFADHILACAQASGRPFKRILFLDLETRSELNLTKIDAETYARHPSTEVMCARWALDDRAIEHWDETYFESLLDLCPLLTDPETILCVHNAEFEPKIFRHVLGIDIEVERILDSAAVARHAGLPGALDPLAEFFGGGKDAEGRKAMLKLSKPRPRTKTHPEARFWQPHEKPDDFAFMYTYCGWDVHWMREAMRYMPPLPVFEWRVYRATHRMNARGFPIDRRSAQTLQLHVNNTRARMSADTEKRFGFSLSQVKEIAAFLDLPGVAKNVIRDYLKLDIPAEHREVAEARQTFAKTSVDKIKTMLARSGNAESNVYDGDEWGAVHDGVIYGGAERTLRFSGSGVQPQNLVRGMGAKQDKVFEAIEIDGCFELIYGGEELPTIAEVIRGLIAHKFRKLNVGDYSQIEARLLAWMVGDEALLSAFREGRDPYKMMAGKIYHKDAEDVTDKERFMGKQTVLGCGYGLGKYGFAKMLDETYDVQIEEDEADELVNAYRKNAPRVRRFWKRLDKALLYGQANVGQEFMVQRGDRRLTMKFTREDRFWIKLPSGRKLRYYNVEKTKTKRGYSWSCFGRIQGSNYGRVKLYGGALTGHIIQSTARDVIATAMVELDDRGHDLILTVHDELVELDDDNFDEFEEVMNVPPPWLTDFPLAVDAFTTERYRK